MSASRPATLADLSTAERRAAIVAEMRSVIDAQQLSVLNHARYHLGWIDEQGRASDAPAGKMLRPALTLLACEAFSGQWQAAIPAAAAVELLHNFSLIHDDIEDNGTERHHRPTLWTRCGIPRAINAGDALFVCARQALSGLLRSGVPPEVILIACERFDRASLRLCQGQDDDLTLDRRLDVTLNDYLGMVAGKTGALMGAALELGALVGGAAEPPRASFRDVGEWLGVAFQMRDDLLGVWGKASETGKVADDLIRRKRGLPLVLAMRHLQGGDRTALHGLLAQPEMAERDVGELAALLERAGIRANAEQLIVDWGERIRDALWRLRGLCPHPDVLDDLDQLAGFAMEREF